MTDCILHKGCVNNSGYGLKWYAGKLRGAHVVSYLNNKGPIPEGLVVMHSCDNRLCVNPEHLSIGTYSENMIDCVSKGRKNSPHSDSHYNSKLSAEEVKSIRKSGLTATELTAMYPGVSRRTLSDVLTGKTWRHVDG
ncbi:HNH endonuclease [Escherichia phage GA2A]|uniref:HNH nuclease domain-containing protein n=1 Tax=Escherichia phage GA2A TaxID=1755695 RepID=A0A1B0TRC2_9CAUD|nr:HNH endonuclease [Escherichia phage GA2A]ALP47802.1 hypothetical protein GA2A_35 [Escherichia phage GA2A]